MKKLALVLFFALFASGCSIATTHIAQTDPSHLRVLIKIDTPSNYKVRLEGAVTGWKEPGEPVIFNAPCAGKFDGVAHAYKVIGKTETGMDVLFYMGESVFSFRTDGYNIMYDRESYDDVVVISWFYKYSNMPFGAEKTHYPFYTGPCGSIFLPDVQFQWGK